MPPQVYWAASACSIQRSIEPSELTKATNFSSNSNYIHSLLNLDSNSMWFWMAYGLAWSSSEAINSTWNEEMSELTRDITGDKSKRIEETRTRGARIARRRHGRCDGGRFAERRADEPSTMATLAQCCQRWWGQQGGETGRRRTTGTQGATQQA
jgi:hypothetical protein